MSADLGSWLDRTRPAAPAPASVLAAPPEGKAYRAWGRGHPESAMLDVRLRADRGMNAQGELLPLQYLMRVTYTESPRGDTVTLAFADCLISVRGERLGALRGDLVAGKVDFLEQFDAARWSAVLAGDPIITEIEVLAPGRSRV